MGLQERISISRAMFRGFDLRIDASMLDREHARLLVHAHARYFIEYLHTRMVVLCRDARTSGSRFLQQAVDEFCSLGFSVFTDPLPTSTCRFYHLCMEYPGAAGIMYTASHNPGRYTGQKIVGPGLVPISRDHGPGKGLSSIEANFLEGKQCEAEGQGSVTCVSNLEAYVDFVTELAGVGNDAFAGLSIVCDYVSGSAGMETSVALARTKARICQRNLVPDGSFPQGDPNPMIRSTVRPMLEQLAGGSFDLGFCFDGDGDRVDVYDGKGRQISPSINFSLIADYMVKISYPFEGDSLRHAFLDPKASCIAHRALLDKRIQPHLIKNGHSIVKSMLLSESQRPFIGAVEESGHYYFHLPWYKFTRGFAAWESTLLVVLLTCRMWMERRSEALQMIEAFQLLHREREWGIRCSSDSQRSSVLDAVAQAFNNKGAILVDSMEQGEPLGGLLIRLERDDDQSFKTWVQIAQRASESEEHVARWEAVSNSRTLLEEAVAVIRSISREFAPEAIPIG